MELTESIRFITTDVDKALLTILAKQDGDSSMSATLRRLIRQEAERRGIPLFTPTDIQQPESQIFAKG